MRIELWILFITIALIYNAYYDGIYTKMVKDNMKYIKIGMIGLGGIILYLFFKRHPSESHKMLQHASEMIKYMPLDKNSKDLVTPFFDLTSNSTFFSPKATTTVAPSQDKITPQMKRMLQSGGRGRAATLAGNMKRSVSETKKKYVASQQKWSCGHCKKQLDASFEVDHIIELQHGGTNEITNLVALCRNCHGKKTTMNKLYN